MATDAKRLTMPDPRTAVTDEILMEHIEPGSRVVDLGCGDGRLLELLRTRHRCDGLGVERDFDQFLGGIGRGLSMIRADLNQGLSELPDNSFDFAVLSQTLQQVDRPKELLEEIMRIAWRALVVVPNFGNWRVRMKIAFRGRAPVTDALPYEWYESPNVHFLSMLDFRELVSQGNFRIVKELPIIGSRAVRRAWLPNLRAHSALYILEHPREPA